MSSTSEDTPSTVGEGLKKPSVPSTDPEAEDQAAESLLSRKREREVSQEPGTPKAEEKLDSERTQLKDRPVVSKKTKPTLYSTAEESPTPPLSTSPPHETKIRQISQGVEDISWRNGQPVSDDADPIPDSQGPEVPATQESCVSDDAANDDSQDVITNEDERDTSDYSEAPAATTETATSSQPESDPDTNMPEAEKLPLESSKRPRDDESDANPRQTKRPTPPPAEEAKPRATAPNTTLASDGQALPIAPKLSGFMAYASSSSPFATVGKGPKVFGRKSPGPTSSLSSAVTTPGPSTSTLNSNANTPGIPPSPGTATSMKRTGFEAFASSASPFASYSNSPNRFRSQSPSAYQRSKSPTRRAPNNVTAKAFSSYAAMGSSAFAVPPTKRAKAGSPGVTPPKESLERNDANGTDSENVNPLDTPTGHGDESGEGSEEEAKESTFGERLRAGKDDEQPPSDEEVTKLELQEREVVTGEETEETVCSVRGKLYLLSEGQWKERGVGTLKVNRQREDGSSARLVMRKEAIYSLILNAPLFKGMSCFLAQDPRYLRFSVIGDGQAMHYNLKVGTAKQAQELLDGINANIPTA